MQSLQLTILRNKDNHDRPNYSVTLKAIFVTPLSNGTAAEKLKFKIIFKLFLNCFSMILFTRINSPGCYDACVCRVIILFL